MVFNSIEDYFAILKESDAASMYKAAKEFGKFHKYIKNDRVSIDSTSQTVMNGMIQKTSTTPFDEIESMRIKRSEAFTDFCYIYGGYIAWKLKCKCLKRNYTELVLDEYIPLAAGQVLDCIIRTLQKKGYKKGFFSHLVHRAIRNKFIDLEKKYTTWKKKSIQTLSYGDAEEMLGGKIELDEFANYADESQVEFDIDEDMMHSCGLMGVIKRVKTANTHDDCEMFELHCINKVPLKTIAKEFKISISTASKRINNFADAALKMYRQYQQKMEEQESAEND